MRRLLGVLVCAALVVAGCGSSSSAPSASSVRNTELSYFPAGSAFVMSVVTDPNSAAVKGSEALVGSFPLATFGESALIAKLRQVGIDYTNDIRPLFGNPIVVGATGQTLSGASSSAYLAVWVTKDASKLTALLKKIPGVKTVGSHDGATLYQTGGATTVAVDGATLLIGPSESAVASALDRHAHGGGIASTQFSRAFAGLSQDSLIEMFGNLSQVLSSPNAANARRVPWVAALHGYAAAVSANSSGLTFQYHLDTTGATLTAAELPFAAGTTPPNLAGTLPITVAIHNPSQIAAFLESAEQTMSSGSYTQFLRRQAAVRAKTGVDLNSLLRLLTGDLIVASDTHTTMGRAGVSDPAAAASTLSKLASAPRSVFNKATSITHLSGGFYAIHEPGQTITLGVVGSQLVVGKATAAQLRSFASAPTTPAAGAHGAVAFRIALVDLLHLTLKQAPPQIVQTILKSLGDLTGWTAASPSGITGSATLAVH